MKIEYSFSAAEKGDGILKRFSHETKLTKITRKALDKIRAELLDKYEFMITIAWSGVTKEIQRELWKAMGSRDLIKSIEFKEMTIKYLKVKKDFETLKYEKEDLNFMKKILSTQNT